jgi:hypothetical protein
MTTHVLTSEKMTFIVLRIDRAISKGLERGRSTRKIQKKIEVVAPDSVTDL